MNQRALLARRGGRKKTLVAGGVAVAVLLPGGAAFAVGSHASDQVCAAVANPTADGLPGLRSAVSGTENLLFLDDGLRRAVRGLSADLDRMQELQQQPARPDVASISAALSVMTSADGHVREAQQACDLPITGLPGSDPFAGASPGVPSPASSPVRPAPRPSASASAPSRQPDLTDGRKTVVPASSGDGRVELAVSGLRAGVHPTEYSQAREGQYLRVRIRVTAVQGSPSVSPIDFRLVTADGSAYDSSAVLAGDAFDYVDLRPGRTVTGMLYFDIPKGAQAGSRIVYRQSRFAGGEVAAWRF